MIGSAVVIFRTLPAFFTISRTRNVFLLEFLPNSAHGMSSYWSFCQILHTECRPTGVFAKFCTQNVVLLEFLPFPAHGITSQEIFCPFPHTGSRLKKFFKESRTRNYVSRNFLPFPIHEKSSQEIFQGIPHLKSPISHLTSPQKEKLRQTIDKPYLC